jgi:hypothetical protein
MAGRRRIRMTSRITEAGFIRRNGDNQNARDEWQRAKENETMKDNAEQSIPSRGSVSIGEAQNTGEDEWWCDWYRCPRCDRANIAYDFRFCPNCGVQLQWQQ